MKVIHNFVCYFLVFILLFNLLLWPANAQVLNQVTSVDFKNLPDGNYNMNQDQGILAVTRTVLDFNKRGNKIQGTGNIEISTIAGGYEKSKFCFKGEIKNNRIIFTRSFSVEPNFEPFFDTASGFNISPSWIIRTLKDSEVQNTTLRECDNYHELFNSFEDFYNKVDEFYPYFESAAGNTQNVAQNADAAVKNYKAQVKKLTDEILEEVDSGKISPKEAKLKLANLSNKIVLNHASLQNSIGIGVVSSITGDPSKSLSDAFNHLSLEKYKTGYRNLAPLEKAKVAKEILLKAAVIQYKAENLESKFTFLGKYFKILKYFDIALTIAQWATSENLFAAVLKDVLILFAQFATRGLALNAANYACLFTGLLAVGCTLLLSIATGIVITYAAENGFDLVEEWLAKDKGIFDSYVFWDATTEK